MVWPRRGEWWAGVGAGSIWVIETVLEPELDSPDSSVAATCLDLGNHTGRFVVGKTQTFNLTWFLENFAYVY